MVYSVIKNIKIGAVAAAVSNKWTALEELADETNLSTVNKFSKKTGVLGRFDAGEKQTTSDFCYVAARGIIEGKNIDLSEIGILVFVTQTPDYVNPATACVLQHRLGLSKDCIVFDVNLGCSGYTYGLNIVASMMSTSNVKKALLLCGDTSAKKKKNNKSTTNAGNWLFGDGGTATLLEKDESADKISIISKTDGSGYKAIITPYEQWRNPQLPLGVVDEHIMDDIEVFNFAIDEVPKILREHMEVSEKKAEDYDGLFLHQANAYIIKNVAKRAGFDMQKVPVSLDKFGNTSSSSIPITLVKEYGNMSDKKINVLMCGFGIGLSWSSVDTTIDVNDILPLIHTDEYYLDGFTN